MFSDFTDTYILQNCSVTLPIAGTIRVSCDPYHQILVTVTCINCNNSNMVTSNGSSPLTVGGLDPGMMYSVVINVFDDNQVVLSDQTINVNITVMDAETGKIFEQLQMMLVYVCRYLLKYKNQYIQYILMYSCICTAVYVHASLM